MCIKGNDFGSIGSLGNKADCCAIGNRDVLAQIGNNTGLGAGVICRVDTHATIKKVITFPAGQDIITLKATDCVIAGAANEHIIG